MTAIKAAFGVGLAVAGLASVSAFYQASAEWADRRRYPPPGRLVRVDGRRLHLWGRGEGGPVVVVVPALGTVGLEWAHVQALLAPSVRVLLYDRGGLGWSDHVLGPRTIGRLADELAALLASSGETGPFVFVGHSVGGVIARDLVTRYRDQAAGLVLVESSHELQTERLAEAGEVLPGPWSRVLRRRARWLGAVRALDGLGLVVRDDAGSRVFPPELRAGAMAMDASSRQRRARTGELLGLERGFAEAYRRRERLDGLPLSILTAGGRVDGDALPHAEEVWRQLQADLAGLAIGSRHMIVEGAGHHLHRDTPDVVARTILAVVEDARTAPREGA